MTTPLPLPHQKKSLEMFVNPKAGKLTDYHNTIFFSLFLKLPLTNSRFIHILKNGLML
jgi:hypothetical protein